MLPPLGRDGQLTSTLQAAPLSLNSADYLSGLHNFDLGGNYTHFLQGLPQPLAHKQAGLLHGLYYHQPALSLSNLVDGSGANWTAVNGNWLEGSNHPALVRFTRPAGKITCMF